MNPTCRAAVVADIPQIVELWKEFLDFHADCGRDLDVTRSPDGHETFAAYLADLLEDEDYLVLVADDGERLVGYCIAAIKDHPPVFNARQYGFIQDMAVTAACRRRGLGCELFARAEAWIRGRGLNRIHLNVDTTNPVSQAFWKRLGFGDYMKTLARTYD